MESSRDGSKDYGRRKGGAEGVEIGCRSPLSTSTTASEHRSPVVPSSNVRTKVTRGDMTWEL
jgi:hypothetical protein